MILSNAGYQIELSQSVLPYLSLKELTKKCLRIVVCHENSGQNKYFHVQSGIEMLQKEQI